MIDVMTTNNAFSFASDFGSLLEPTHETAAQKNQSVEGINPADVICGRDKLTHAHCGNKRFRHIIEMNREAYQTAPSREKKTSITIQIVKMIRECGGRFLKQDEATGMFEEVTPTYAREKVSHALRSAKDPNRPRIKKKREVRKYVPTPQEDAQFQETLRDQQKIFQSLLEREARGLGELNMGDSLNIFSGL